MHKLANKLGLSMSTVISIVDFLKRKSYICFPDAVSTFPIRSSDRSRGAEERDCGAQGESAGG